MQVFESLDFCKAQTVTTGAPGSPCPEAMEDPEKTEESPRSLLSPLSSIDSPLSSFKSAACLRNVKILGPNQLKIARDAKGSVDTEAVSVADSELRRSLRNHGSEEKKVRDFGLLLEAAQSRALRCKVRAKTDQKEKYQSLI